MRVNRGSTNNQVHHMLKQLRYFGEITMREDYVSLPNRPSRPDVLAAFDIMFELSAGNKISVMSSEKPYVLIFTVAGRNSAAVYAIVAVKRGREQEYALRLPGKRSSALTLILLLETLEQQQYFDAIENVYFAYHDGSKYRYFDGGGQ